HIANSGSNTDGHCRRSTGLADCHPRQYPGETTLPNLSALSGPAIQPAAAFLHLPALALYWLVRRSYRGSLLGPAADSTRVQGRSALPPNRGMHAPDPADGW